MIRRYLYPISICGQRIQSDGTGRRIGVAPFDVTNARYFLKASFPVVVWSTIDETVHSPDEYYLKKNFIDDPNVWDMRR